MVCWLAFIRSAPRRFRRTLFSFLFCLILFIAPGCGGKQTVKPSAGGRGRAVFSVRWPTRSRLIPSAANSIKIILFGDVDIIAQKTLPRPPSGGVGEATFENLPTGTLTVNAVAYPGADGSGVAQAQATAPVVIESNKTADLNLTMESGIDHITVSLAPGQSVEVGKTATLLVSPAKRGRRNRFDR